MGIPSPHFSGRNLSSWIFPLVPRLVDRVLFGIFLERVLYSSSSLWRLNPMSSRSPNLVERPRLADVPGSLLGSVSRISSIQTSPERWRFPGFSTASSILQTSRREGFPFLTFVNSDKGRSILCHWFPRFIFLYS